MPRLTGRARYRLGADKTLVLQVETADRERIGANLIPVLSWRDASVEDLTIEARDLIRRGG